MRIYIAGHTGLVGSALTRAVDSGSGLTWIGKPHKDLDLTDRKAVFEYVSSEKPDAMIIAAAKVGGIMANATYPVEFLSQNIQISTNLIDAAHEANIERLVFLGSSCAYPKLSPQPIREEYLLEGPLESTNSAYAIAKIAGIKLVDAYRQQFKRNWNSVMPTNLYGQNDNYERNNSHVIPALIRKFHEAEIDGSEMVSLWGSGSVLREFLHADDLAAAILTILEKDAKSALVNVGSGEELTIAELAGLVANTVGYSHQISWDRINPDGTPRKLLDSAKVRSLGWKPKISLPEGLRSAYIDFKLQSLRD